MQVEQYYSDDYAGLESGNLKFYYGYEVEDPLTEDWCFQVKKDGKEIEVVNNAEDDKENIIQDFVSIITSYCARIYGNRRSKRKTEQLIKELEK